MSSLHADAKAEAPVLLAAWCKQLTHWKDPDLGKDWGQEEKRATEDETVGWHHQLNEHEFEQNLGDSEGQGNLVCYSPCGHSQTQLSDNRVTFWPFNFTLRFIFKKIKTYIFMKTNTNVHSNTISNSQKAEMMHIFINWSTDKQNLVHPNNGIWFGNKREWNADVYCNMDEPWKHGVQWKKPSQNTTCCMIPLTWSAQDGQIHRDMTQAGVGRGAGNQLWVIEWLQWVWNFFWADENVLNLNCDNGYTILYSNNWTEWIWDIVISW